MGYYSEVALIMENSTLDAVCNYFEDNMAVRTALDCASVIPYRNEYTILRWTFFKMLESINAIITYLGEEEYDYHYIRIGDEVGDVEEFLAEYDDIMNDAFCIPNSICFTDEVSSLLKTQMLYNKGQA